MDRIGFTSYQDSRLPQPFEPDERIEALAETLKAEVLADPKRLAEECAEVIGWESPVDADLAALFDVHPADLDARCLEFVRGLMRKVEDRITTQAHDSAVAQIEAADLAAELDRAEANEIQRDARRFA